MMPIPGPGRRRPCNYYGERVMASMVLLSFSLLSQPQPATSFRPTPPSPLPPPVHQYTTRRWSSPRPATNQPTKEEQQPLGLGRRGKEEPGEPSSLAISTQYEAAMESLSEEERYNFLVQGGCTKVMARLAGSGSSKAQGGTSLYEEFRPLFGLVKEMTAKRILCTSTTFSRLVDAASLSRDLTIMQECITLASRNGACQAFAKAIPRLPSPQLERRSVLQGLEPLPQDNRVQEVWAGLASMVVVGGSLSYEAVAPLFELDTTPATILLLLTMVGLGWDLIKGNSKALGLVVAGLTRLFLRDAERESRVQAATFLVAYLLGLPCFCFRPNVLETLRMAEKIEPESRGSYLSSIDGLNVLLIYLLAPVAAERSQHQQLIVSDPRQAQALLQLVKDRYRGLQLDDDKADALVTWAYSQAQKLLSSHSEALESLRKRMQGGGATAGDCAAIVEKS